MPCFHFFHRWVPIKTTRLLDTSYCKDGLPGTIVVYQCEKCWDIKDKYFYASGYFSLQDMFHNKGKQ